MISSILPHYFLRRCFGAAKPCVAGARNAYGVDGLTLGLILLLKWKIDRLKQQDMEGPVGIKVMIMIEQWSILSTDRYVCKDSGRMIANPAVAQSGEL